MFILLKLEEAVTFELLTSDVGVENLTSSEREAAPGMVIALQPVAEGSRDLVGRSTAHFHLLFRFCTVVKLSCDNKLILEGRPLCLQQICRKASKFTSRAEQKELQVTTARDSHYNDMFCTGPPQCTLFVNFVAADMQIATSPETGQSISISSAFSQRCISGSYLSEPSCCTMWYSIDRLCSHSNKKAASREND